MTPLEIYQNKINKIFSGFKDGTIIHGRCIYHLVKCDFDKIDEILYDGDEPENCDIAKPYFVNRNYKTNRNDSIFAKISKDKDGNVSIMPVASCCPISSSVNCIYHILNDKEDSKITCHFTDNQHVKQLSSTSNLPLENYISSSDNFKNLKEDNMPIKVKINKTDSFEQRLEKTLESIEVGKIVYGQCIRQLLCDTNSDEIHVNLFHKKYARDDKNIPCDSDVNSLFGEVVLNNGKKDIKIFDTVINNNSTNITKILNLIKNKETDFGINGVPNYDKQFGLFNLSEDNFEVNHSYDYDDVLTRSYANVVNHVNTSHYYRFISEIYNTNKKENALKKAAESISKAKKEYKEASKMNPINEFTVDLSNTSSFEERLQKCIIDVPIGRFVYGDFIRKLISNDETGIACVKSVNDINSDEYPKVTCDVNSLFGKVILREDGRKDIEIYGSLIKNLKPQAVINLILNKQSVETYVAGTDVKLKADGFTCGSQVTNPEKMKISGMKYHIGYYDELISDIYNKHKSIPKETDSKQVKKVKENKMEKSSIMDRTKKNLEEGAYQGVAQSAVTNVTNLLVQSIKSSGLDDSSAEKLCEILNTKIGFAAISMAIGSGVMLIPDGYAENKHVQKLADKCQQNASAAGIEQLITFVVNILKPSIDAALNSSSQIKFLDKLEEKTNPVRVKMDDVTDEEYELIQQFRQSKNSL